jgi:adenylate cyclase class 2
VLRRTEIEFVVENFDRPRTFLEALGYQVIFTYIKFRIIYGLGDTHIMLDELPFGDFVDIEGADVGAINANVDRPNLNRGASITAGYHVLYEGLCAKRPDLDPQRLTFDTLKGKVFLPGEFSLLPADR